MEAWYRKIFCCWTILSVSLSLYLYVSLFVCLFVCLSFSHFCNFCILGRGGGGREEKGRGVKMLQTSDIQTFRHEAGPRGAFAPKKNIKQRGKHTPPPPLFPYWNVTITIACDLFVSSGISHIKWLDCKCTMQWKKSIKGNLKQKISLTYESC